MTAAPGGVPHLPACTRASAALDVLMRASFEEQCETIRRVGLELAPEELLASATARGAELEGITAVLLLTDEDDFNAPARRPPPQPWRRRTVYRR